MSILSGSLNLKAQGVRVIAPSQPVRNPAWLYVPLAKIVCPVPS